VSSTALLILAHAVRGFKQNQLTILILSGQSVRSRPTMRSSPSEITAACWLSLRLDVTVGLTALMADLACGFGPCHLAVSASTVADLSPCDLHCHRLIVIMLVAMHGCSKADVFEPLSTVQCRGAARKFFFSDRLVGNDLTP